MRALRPLSKFLMLLPIATLVYDLVKEWFVYNRLRIRSLEQGWTWLHAKSYEPSKHAIEAFLGKNWTDKIMAWPAPVSLLIPPIALYILYWIWFKFKGGHSTGAYTYKSKD